MLPTAEYWRAVGCGIDAEEAKAGLFITHKGSIGAAREAILRDFLFKRTPDPYRITNGFIYQFRKEFWSSRQCDILVYDPTIAQPHYAIGNLSVVPRTAANLVIEVKTTLGAETFAHILEVHESVAWLPVPTFGFAYDGPCFETFLKYLTTAMSSKDAGVADCIAVHRQNYLFVRSWYSLNPQPEATPTRHRPARYQFAINFGAAELQDGRATCLLLDLYLKALRKKRLDDSDVYDAFQSLQLPKEALARITNEGGVEWGPLPEGK